ncbi:hypothetical protein RAB80_015861 [Fusarium oxysporum f. sp. vasinfectum]|uniref:Uncharacterized protein n=1 Tax=Fusarium oxysporum f. sp. vasinfectum 25433 TaxID=1089449 RepID=X0KTX0_FUSOX|nr:hypothetical protein FOTG_14721 [Fusarium oxysporum f. sp. vasinfectum 25433]KAK2668481.1 hypothetical protein RAB80_015861 [Fusarium oxysporum f. sp. vasinfectum]
MASSYHIDTSTDSAAPITKSKVSNITQNVHPDANAGHSGAGLAAEHAFQ